MKRVAALVPNVLGVSPGQRVRIETWAEHLRAAGWEVDFYPFEDERLHEVLYHPAPPQVKVARLQTLLMEEQLKQLQLQVELEKVRNETVERGASETAEKRIDETTEKVTNETNEASETDGMGDGG